MKQSTIARTLTKSRLRILLVAFFLALALPTAFLVWQAYGQLKWEAFHQYRGMAEELTDRIDAGLTDGIRSAEARTVADYSFLVVAGDPGANFLQRSPLSAVPVSGDLPGSVGYFQVGAQGEFSTPLLPPDDATPESVGIGQEEYRARHALANELQAILSDNRLVEYRPDRVAPDAAQGAKLKDRVAAVKEEDARLDKLARTNRESGSAPAVVARAKDRGERSAAISNGSDDRHYSQLAFDELNKTGERVFSDAKNEPADDDSADPETEVQENESRDRVADLKLDSAYEKKSAALEQVQQRLGAAQRTQPVARVTRKEQSQVPQAAENAGQVALNALTGIDLKILTFESEIDPLEFSLLDSGHFVLFRRVWRDGERIVQGALIDRRKFIANAVEVRFRNTALSTMSNLIVAYQDDVLETFASSAYESLKRGASDLDGALLYRGKLSAPLGSVELVFSIDRLPPGPGATVLGWVTLVLAVVLCGGFFALYRTALGQIALARQQQDFVSAVSHELKTPLTSIRMYGEMLKEGWADEEKKQVYYEFIHDESERLTRLISNVLQLANLSRGDPRLELRPVAAGDLLGQAEANIASQVGRADVEFSFSGDPGAADVLVDIDEDAFAQIMINLVDNAIKFSREASDRRIEISNHLTGDGRIVFSVRDYGPGVPNDQMKKIFEMFYRSESELTRETVGTGIGLAIVHQLSQAMAARIDVSNRNPGAEFRVSFPVSVGMG